MARRSTARGTVVPGACVALAAHCRRFAGAWDSTRHAALADALERGEDVAVTGSTLAHAMAYEISTGLFDDGRYILGAGDVLAAAADEVSA